MTLEEPRAADGISPEALDYAMFGPEDHLKFVLQRSEILWDVKRPGRLVKAWTEGDAAPLEAAVAGKGAEIPARVVAEIGAEYRALMAALGAPAPRRVADIGCGYGVFDLFAAREAGAEVILIDIEANDRRHFGFAEQGAAYSDLSRAVAFLTRNGVPPEKVRALNPERDDLHAVGEVDLAVSLLACGFHFPVSAYMPFFERNVAPGGRIVLDLREGQFARQSEQLVPLGALREIDRRGNRRRVVIEKEG